MDNAITTSQQITNTDAGRLSTARIRARMSALLRRKEIPAQPPEKLALLKELDETLLDLRHARDAFEQASDPEIIEACIYEIKSAEARYGYLLRKAKRMDLTRGYPKSRVLP